MLTDNAPATGKPGNMPGFDPEFTDIVDYILRITLRIWEGKQVGLCERYYSHDCPVYTLAGYTEGAEAVTQGTLKTLGSFPDRTLDAVNIVWSGDASSGFHSSHLIDTQMTHVGATEHGAGTGRKARFHVIAHCVVRENRIVEEWLVRDNWRLAEQLGTDPEALARQLAAQPVEPESVYAQWLDSEWRRVNALPRTTVEAAGDTSSARVVNVLSNLWNGRLIGDCHALYAEDAVMHASASEPLNGISEIEQFFIGLLGALPDVRFSIDHVCTNSMLEGDFVAVRWTLAGTHSGGNIWGPPSNAPVLILGESHMRLENGRVIEEWFVYDKIAVLTQIERVRRATTRATTEEAS